MGIGLVLVLLTMPALQERGKGNAPKQGPGVAAGTAAPDFELRLLGTGENSAKEAGGRKEGGKEKEEGSKPATVKLSSLRDKPVLLIFGSYT